MSDAEKIHHACAEAHKAVEWLAARLEAVSRERDEARSIAREYYLAYTEGLPGHRRLGMMAQKYPWLTEPDK